jgi:hypothetical protein
VLLRSHQLRQVLTQVLGVEPIRDPKGPRKGAAAKR